MSRPPTAPLHTPNSPRPCLLALRANFVRKITYFAIFLSISRAVYSFMSGCRGTWVSSWVRGSYRCRAFCRAAKRPRRIHAAFRVVFPVSRRHPYFSGFAYSGEAALFFLPDFIHLGKGILQFRQSFPLGGILRVIIEKTDKIRSVAPVGIFQFHTVTLSRFRGRVKPPTASHYTPASSRPGTDSILK